MAGEIDDILSGKETAPEAVIEQPVETVEAPPEVEPAQAAPAAPTAAEPEKTVPLAALMAERDKAKEYKARLAALEQQQPAPPKPDFYADPENYVQTTVKSQALQMSVAMVETQYPDFRERLAVFMEEAAKNPILAAQVEAHPHPALFAYQTAKKIEDFRAMSDVDGYKAKLRAEIEAEVKAKFEAEQKALNSKRASLPPDLSVVRGSKNEPAPADESIRSILGR